MKHNFFIASILFSKGIKSEIVSISKVLLKMQSAINDKFYSESAGVNQPQRKGLTNQSFK